MVMAMPLAAARLGVLEGVLKPQMIQVHGGELFVAEGQYIHVFSLPDMKKKFRIGKDGEGPGEFKLDPARTIIFSFTTSRAVVSFRISGAIPPMDDRESIMVIRCHPDVKSMLWP